MTKTPIDREAIQKSYDRFRAWVFNKKNPLYADDTIIIEQFYVNSITRKIADEKWLKNLDACYETLARHAALPGSDDGYKDAFYKIGEILGIPASPHSPKHIFETVMLPKIKELVSRDKASK